MKTFAQLFENMNYPEALKVFGYKGGDFNGAQLKADYKKLALQFHPDRGGSTEKMKQVNAAYETLRNSGGSSGIERESNEERTDRVKMFGKTTLESVLQKFKPEAFVKYFEGIFPGDSFDYKTESTNISKMGPYSSFIQVQTEFFNKDRSTVIDFNVSVNFSSLFGVQALGQGGEYGLSMILSTSILYNRRKLKLSPKNYSFEDNYSVLADPAQLFPADKFARSKKTDTKRKMSKRDVILTFEKELDARWDGKEWLRIPLGPDFELLLYRMTFRGEASWGINGLYKARGSRVQQFSTTFFYEEQETMSWLVDQLKAVKATEQSAINTNIERIIADYKQKRGH